MKRNKSAWIPGVLVALRFVCALVQRALVLKKRAANKIKKCGEPSWKKKQEES